MKLKTLILHNIASIRDAEINFDIEPLSSADVFLIFGKTGAGKSTILDAICLALYDKIPRFENNIAEGNLETDNELPINSTRQILRHKTGEGFVQLSFMGNNGIDYVAIWEVHRTRNNPLGTLQPRHWQLKRIPDNLTLTRPNDIKEEIRICVGLDFTQFCRTSMLAQGEFSKFLNSKDNDKAAILERITGTDIYSRIGYKIHEICAEKKKQWIETNSRISNIQIHSREEIKHKEEELETHKMEYEKTEKNLIILKSKREWLFMKESLEKNLCDALQEKLNAEEQLKQEDFLQKQKLIEDWTYTDGPRKWIQIIHDNERKRNIEIAKLEELKKEYIKFISGVVFEKITIDDIEKKLETLDTYFKQEILRNDTIKKCDIIGIHLAALLENRQTITIEQENINLQKERIDKNLNIALEKETSNITDLQKELEDKSNAIANEEKELDTIAIDTLRYEKEKKSNSINEIQLILVNLNNFLDLEKKHISEKLDIKKLIEEVKKREKDLTKLKTELEQAVSKEEISRKIFDSQKDTITTFAKTMRARLHIGDDCPVCRQKIQHIFMPEDKIDNLIRSYELEWEKDKNKLNDRIELYNKSEAELKAIKNQLNNLQIINNRGDTELKDKQKQLLIQLKALGIEELTGYEVQTLHKIIQEKSLELSNLTASINSVERREKSLRVKKQEVIALQKYADEVKNRIQKLKDEIISCNTLIAISSNTITNIIEKNRKIEKTLENIIIGKWNSDWRTNTDKFLKELKKATDTYNERLGLKEQLEKRREEINLVYKEAIAIKVSIVQKMPNWEIEFSEQIPPIKMPEIITKGNYLINNISGVLNNMNSISTEIEYNKNNIKKYISVETRFTISQIESLATIKTDQLDALNQEIRKVTDNHLSKTTTWKDAQKNLEKHNQQKPPLSENETLTNIEESIKRLEEERKNIIQRIGAINRDIEENNRQEKQIENLKREITAKKLEYNKWYSLDRYIGNPDGSLFRKIAQSYVLESLIHSANHYMNTLSGRYRLRNIPGSFVIMVDDAYQGGNSRAASTLSGGETFLVSLSLALALSDIGERIGMDILFIDEGFGTLSGEPLENAVETLRALHHRTGRHVGIISHIEELQERIPVRILVNQEGNSSFSHIEIQPPMTNKF